ncbi:MAG: ATP-dependent zinc metalloprotease FtsH [Clostridiales bacterium]|nr:ATP-dependent zinc metalloprotease FtsH [Clostridiales bacterium]
MNNKKFNYKAIIPYIVIPVLFICCIMFFTNQQSKAKTEYYEIVKLFDQNKVTEYDLDLSSGRLRYKLKGEDDKIYEYTVPNVSLFIDDVHTSVMKYNRQNPNNQIKANYISGSSNSWWVSMIPYAILILMSVVIVYFMFRRMNQTISSENNRALSFSKAKAKLNSEDNKTTFDDVAGADEEKEELAELVDFLKNPLAFNDLGARIPKGVLLVGPPGTGKTLLARAVAGEAGVPFFSISGSDFVEMYVGVGASRVRDLFEQAKKNSPAIVFIDEIDAVGRHRGAGMGGGHDEREQTLNQLLVEMDGFGKNQGVIIIAATNRPDILDPALLRPGRFDRQVTVGIPDVKGREDILKVHAKGKPFAPDVDLNKVAHSTVGFTGADLENLLNESALLAARRKKKAITMNEIDEATIKVMVGTEKKSHKMTPEDKRITAYHEAGHAIVTYYLEGQDPVQQISIIPRGMAAGFTLSRPENDNTHISRTHMLDEIVVLLGGRVAEAVAIGDICTGASNDIERATNIARNMITRYGMSEKLGPINYGKDNDEIFLGRDYTHMRDYSEAVSAAIDAEVNEIITNAYKRAEDIIRGHFDKLDIVAKELIEVEKIEGDRFKVLMSEDYVPETKEEKPEGEESVENTEIVSPSDTGSDVIDAPDTNGQDAPPSE